MTQPRAVEPVLGGGRFPGLRACGSPGACLGLSNSPTARFTLCHPTAHSWLTPSPGAETLVTPTGQPPRSARFREQGLCVLGCWGWSQALLSCPSLLDPGRDRRPEQLGPCAHSCGPLVTRGHLWWKWGGMGGGGDIGGALGGWGVLRMKKRVLPLLDWPVLSPGLPQGQERTHGAGRPEQQDVTSAS